MLHALSLGLVLGALWLLLSGYFVPLILALGLASVVLVVFIAHRMDVIDHEGQPVHLSWRIFPYWLWLLKEIFVSAVHVSGVILQPRMPIRPRMLHLKATQHTELGHVIYANSITLTPGTVTVELDDENLAVHALTEETAEGLESGDMDRRVTAVEWETQLDQLIAARRAELKKDE